MKNFSNTYVFAFASGLVIVVAAILAFLAMQLKPYQEKNVEVEKKQNILKSMHIASTPLDAPAKYDQYITETFVVNAKGEKVDGDAFSIDMKVELSKSETERHLPVFMGITDQKDSVYIVPLRGKGLWGPVWGYLSFQKDLNTIYGAVFDHQGETPGLGAEIVTPMFQEPFKGKQIFDEAGNFVSIEVVKGGADKSNPHQVDGISGGTITSKGVQAMMQNTLSSYKTYFANNKK